MPASPTRTEGRPLVRTFGEPWIAGPTAGCGHAGQPWASAGTMEASPTRAWGGMTVGTNESSLVSISTCFVVVADSCAVVCRSGLRS